MRFVLLLIGIIVPFCVYAQDVSFDFEVSDGSYNNNDYGGGWYVANSMTFGSGKQYAGSKALVFDDDYGAYLLFEGDDGNGKDGGVGTISFYYRHWDGDGKSVKFKVQYDSGSGWVDVGNEISVTSTSYTQFNETVNIAGDDILVRVLSTKYSERCLIDNIVITSFGGGSGGGSTTFALEDDGLIEEELENGEQITVRLENDTFANPLDIADWAIYNQPQGVSLASLTRVNDTTATLVLSGNRTADYDSDITNFTVEAEHSQFDNLSTGSVTVSTGVTFTAFDDPETLSMVDDGSIVEGNEDGEVITVYLHGGTFTSSLISSNWSMFNEPSGIGLNNLTRVNDTTATFTLDGNATSDYDTDITDLEISLDDAEVDDYSGTDISIDAGVTFSAVIEPAPTVQASNISFDDVNSTSIELSWTRGDGEYCIVLVHEDGIVDSVPVNDSDYTANTTFGNGDELGTGNFIVYEGASNSVEVYGLTQGKEYHFQVFEFNNQGAQTRYLTIVGTGNPASSFTSPNNVDAFSVDCISNNSVHLSWVDPAGSYDGIIIAMRESASLAVHTISGNGHDYTASTVFGDGDAFGSTSPNSYVVYNGTGNSVTVTGLTPGNFYSFKAITYIDSLWSSGTTKGNQEAFIEKVTDLQYYAPDQKINVSWTNPSFNCPDEVMMVMKSGSAVTAVPSGDGTAYSADAVFGNGTDLGTGEYVVYKGQDDEIEITGLTNGTEYFFSLFVRDDTVWSDAVEGSVTPDDITVLFPGDLAVLAINTGNSSGDDEISIVCFDTLRTGTSIDITDNGWEREYSDYWGTTEGVIRFTRTGPDVLPGEVFTLTGKGYQSSNFNAHGLADNGWAISSINGNNNLDLNDRDQLWIMQYGNWSTSGSHKGEYTGNVLYGWTATGWAGDPGHGTGTKYSALYPAGECFNTNVVNTASKDKVKYVGDTTATTRREWIARINNVDNWSGYSSDAQYTSGGFDYISGFAITVLPDSYLDGEWVGDLDSNWFNCGNWADLAVPDESTDVLISDKALNECVISSTAAYSDDFNDTARCGSFTLTDSILHFEDPNALLKVEGDVLISGGTLTLNTGSIFLTGDWNNSSSTAFDTGNGKLKLLGSAKQTIGNSAGEEIINTLEVANGANAELSSTAWIGHLKFTTGKLEVGNYEVVIIDSISGYSNTSYLQMDDDTASDGYLIMNIGTQETIFPIGTSASYTPLTMSLNSGSGDFRARTFSNVFSQGSFGDSLDGVRLNHTWDLLPESSGSFSASLTLQWNVSNESSGFAAERINASMLYNNNTGSATDWSDWSAMNNCGSVNGLNPYTVKSTSVSAFGSFTVGVKCIIHKPITSKIYHY